MLGDIITSCYAIAPIVEDSDRSRGDLSFAKIIKIFRNELTEREMSDQLLTIQNQSKITHFLLEIESLNAGLRPRPLSFGAGPP